MRLMGIRIYVIALAYRIYLLYFRVIHTRHVQDRNETSKRKCRKKVFLIFVSIIFLSIETKRTQRYGENKIFSNRLLNDANCLS